MDVGCCGLWFDRMVGWFVSLVRCQLLFDCKGALKGDCNVTLEAISSVVSVGMRRVAPVRCDLTHLSLRNYVFVEYSHKRENTR